jgi:hypothetical protein
LAEAPLKFPSSQLEPIKWSELAGWTADDHLAPFASYQTSCQALLKIRRTDERGELSSAPSNVCRKAMNLRPQEMETARAFLRAELSTPAHWAPARARETSDRPFRADCCGLALSDSAISCPLYRRPRDLVAADGAKERRVITLRLSGSFAVANAHAESRACDAPRAGRAQPKALRASAPSNQTFPT